MIQERFDVTVDLIRQQGDCFSFLQDLLGVCHSSVLIFSFFNKPSRGNVRQNVLAAYRLRAELSPDKNAVAGQLLLLAGLRKTRHAYICVSIFITEKGIFTVFSDFDRKELIGALFTREAPEEVPLFNHLFMNGKLLSRERE